MITEPRVQQSYLDVNMDDVEAKKFAGYDWFRHMDFRDKVHVFLHQRVYKFEKLYVLVYFGGMAFFILICVIAYLKINCCRC